MTKQNILIIGGGLLQLPLVEISHSMGLGTIVFDISPNAIAAKKADDSRAVSTLDVEGCTKEAHEINKVLPIRGVITAGTDASRTVAAIASSLDLHGIRYNDAEAAVNKVLMRRRLKAHSIPVPMFEAIWSLKDLREAADRLGFPLVLKPAENMGSRGVVKINRREELKASFQHSKKYSSTGEMILEEFMEGDELSVDALAWNGKVYISGIADRIISGEPFFIEEGHNMPSQKPREILEEAKLVMKSSMKALGIHTGAAKGDLKITPKKGIFVGEIAARLSGGFMSSHTYPIHSGINLLKAAVNIALGSKPFPNIEQWKGDEVEKIHNRVAIERGIFSPPGKILELGGIDEMKSVSGIENVYITKKQGELMKRPSSNIDKVGHIIASGDSLQEAQEAVLKAKSLLKLEVDERAAIDWKEVEETAREKFGNQTCWVCKICDGVHCASGVPGMGGVGNKMPSFQDNILALAEIQIIPRFIRSDFRADTSIEILGFRLDHPVMAAPMTGAVTNMNHSISEYDFADFLLQGVSQSGGIGWIGDGATPDKYLTVMKALENTNGRGCAIFKPRSDWNELKKRFRLAEEIRVASVGIDIDAVSFKTMKMKKQKTQSYSIDDLKRIRDMTKLPFFLKGILSTEDALAAVEAGMDGIIISNHGGRVLESSPGTARVIEEISGTVKGKLSILADGGIRSGQDIFKMLSLGAEAVLVGRPIAIAAVGGGVQAVENLFEKYARELRETMHLCGTACLEDITSRHTRKKENLVQRISEQKI